MTLEEAKMILEKEGFVVERFLGVLFEDVKTASWEKIEVSEAMRVVAENGYLALMEESKYKERKARLKKEYEKNTKAPGSAENRIKEDSGVNPALAEAASQFNEALLDEQAKDLKRLGKEIARLNSIIHKKNMKIEEFRKESSIHLRGKIKMFVENRDLEGKLKDKDAVLSDVAEELRLSTIREKNLTEVCQKYMKENEKLKKELADKVDARALKSAESALAYKDSYIKKMKNKKVINNRASMEAIAKYVDAVSKAELDGLVLESWKNDGKEITSVYQLKNGKRYTLSLVYTGEEFLFYKTDLDKEPHITTPEISQEELMKIQEKVVASCDIAEEGGDHSGVIVLCGKDFIKKFKKNEDLIHDLFEKKHKEIKEFMSAEAEQLFEGDGIPTKMEVMKPSRKFKKVK